MVAIIGPLRTITDLYFEDELPDPPPDPGGGGGRKKPKYIVLSATLRRPGGTIANRNWIYEDLTFTEAEPCFGNNTATINANTSAGVKYRTQKLTDLSYTVRMEATFDCFAYYPSGGAPAGATTDGQGWYLEPVGPGGVTFNTGLMTFGFSMATEVPSSEVSGSYGIFHPHGWTNFTHPKGNAINIPFPFIIGTTDKFNDDLDVSIQTYVVTIDSSPLCWNPTSASAGLNYYQVTGDEVVAVTPISSLPINASYNGVPMRLVGTRTSDAKASDGRELSNFCDFLFEVV